MEVSAVFSVTLILTIQVAALTTCLDSAQRLYDLRIKYKEASVLITAIYTESQVIAASLSQVQVLLENGMLHKKPELLETFDRALTGCRIVYVCLEEEVRELASKAATNDLDFKNRAKFLWKEDTFKELLTQIRGQQSGLILLLQGLQMESIADIKRLVQENRVVLEKAVKQTRTLRQSHPRIRVPESLFNQPIGHDDDAESTWMGKDTEFAFDDDIVDSKAYRRAMAMALSNSRSKSEVLNNPKDESMHEDATTVVPESDTKSEDTSKIAATNEHRDTFETLERDLLAYMPPTTSIAPQSHSTPNGANNSTKSELIASSPQSYNERPGTIEAKTWPVSRPRRPSEQQVYAPISMSRVRTMSSDDMTSISDAPSMFSQVSAVSSYTSFGASVSTPNLSARPQRKPLPSANKVPYRTLSGMGTPFNNPEMHSIWKSLVDAERKFVDRMLKLKRMFYENVVKQWPILEEHLDAILVGEQIANSHQQHLLQVLDQELSGNSAAVCNPCVFEDWIAKSQQLHQAYAWKMPHAVSSLRKAESKDVRFTSFVNTLGLSITWFGKSWEDYLKLPEMQLQSYIDSLEKLIAIAQTLSEPEAGPQVERLKHALQAVNRSVASIFSVLEESQGREDIQNMSQRLIVETSTLSMLRLDEPVRRVKHQGGMAFKHRSQGPWIPVHAVLFDHYFLLGKTKKNEIVVTDKPVPLVDVEFSLPVDGKQFQKAGMLDLIKRGSVVYIIVVQRKIPDGKPTLLGLHSMHERKVWLDHLTAAKARQQG
ncbi:ankyrin repeat-containing protein [Curvularia clavata]|uniref:Ankyrin repeat-containing protein n=1 Tax=Curvularia clavata TaxID=95742 RepID=A0A9Q9DR98_CURCL|nr:ankyrin repeat-containing protein [Curvularia clavata]